MFYVLLVFHVMVAIALVVVILLQRSEGGALGMGGGGGVVSGRAAGNILTKTTAILGTLFFVNSLVLALMGSYGNKSKSILDVPAPVSAPAAPAAPAEPAAPVAK